MILLYILGLQKSGIVKMAFLHLAEGCVYLFFNLGSVLI